MSDATNYHHLLEDPHFRAWVFDDTDAEYWKQWLAGDPTREMSVNNARTILLALQAESVHFSDQQVIENVSRALNTAKSRETNPSNISHRESKLLKLRRVVFPRMWVAAATVLFLLGAGWIFWLASSQTQFKDLYAEQTSQVKTADPLIEVINERSQPRTVSLPDGSSIVLQQHSRISYPAAFDGTKREVFLAGEAFFEVAKNAEKPFFVYANELVTKVLGTSFSIRAYADSATVDVVVKSGKVSVFAQTDKDISILKDSRELTGMVLLANQQAIFQRSQVRLVRNLVPIPTLLALPIENQNFEFTETPLSQVFATFEEAYGVDIVYDEELMAKCSITARLGDEPLFTKLKWICAITESTYEVTDGQIIFTGKACY